MGAPASQHACVVLVGPSAYARLVVGNWVGGWVGQCVSIVRCVCAFFGWFILAQIVLGFPRCPSRPDAMTVSCLQARDEIIDPEDLRATRTSTRRATFFFVLEESSILRVSHRIFGKRQQPHSRKPTAPTGD